MEKMAGVTLYKSIYGQLKKEILEKAVPGGSFLPSERELCDRFGVDRITVRRSLELLVEDGLVEKRAGVGTMVKEFPLKSPPVADLKNILFVLPKGAGSADRITEPFNTALFYAVEKECKARGYSLIYTTLDADEDFLSIGNGNSISGILLVSKYTEKQYEDCLRTCLPSVVVNNCQESFVSVDADNEEGAYCAVNHLCDLGHRHIGIILGVEGIAVTLARMAGYKRALSDHGIDWHGQAVAYGDWTFDSGYEAMARLLDEAQPPLTAVFAMNDLTAIGAMEAIKERGLEVPGDISVVGFDNVQQCESVRPKLTSVHADVDTIAKVSLNQLIERIETGSRLAYRILIPPSLIIRESTAKPKD